MKNRIMRKIAAAGMAVFLVGMSAGSGYMWKEAPATMDTNPKPMVSLG